MNNRRPRFLAGAIAMLLVHSSLEAQTKVSSDAPQLYTVPCTSHGNSIELAVENASKEDAVDISIAGEQVPSWVKLDPPLQLLNRLAAKSEKTVVFSFNIDESAPIEKPDHLTFRISSPSGEYWEKEIMISVSRPVAFELNQNYPNPFNPTTTISYLLPNPGHVVLTIYSLTGQEIAKLVDEDQGIGYHSQMWDASRLSSGVYFYQIAYLDQVGHREFSRKPMMLLK
jgi:hypothetical protein